MVWVLLVLVVVEAAAIGALVGTIRRDRQRFEGTERGSALNEGPPLPTVPDDPAAAMTDEATGLFNEQFFLVTLETRVAAARRHLRPVAVVLLQLSEGVREGNPEPMSAMVVADGLRTTLRDADTACRLDNGHFALILEDTPENGAVWTVERVRRYLLEANPRQTLWAGIACYPAHAFDATEVLGRAQQALDAALEWSQDRIEVATGEA